MRRVRRVAQRIGRDERDRRPSGACCHETGSGRSRRGPGGRRRSASLPARAAPRRGSGRRTGSSAPGGSSVIVGPFVSTVKRQLLVVREPGKLAGDARLEAVWPVCECGALEDERPFEAYARLVTSTPSSFQCTRSSTLRAAADREREGGEEGRADPGSLRRPLGVEARRREPRAEREGGEDEGGRGCRAATASRKRPRQRPAPKARAARCRPAVLRLVLGREARAAPAARRSGAARSRRSAAGSPARPAGAPGGTRRCARRLAQRRSSASCPASIASKSRARDSSEPAD